MNYILLVSVLLGILGFIILIIYSYFQKKYNYWRNNGIPFLKPIFPFGNLKDAWKYPIGISIKRLYKEAKIQGYRFCGIWIFNKPALLILDPDLIRNILTVDFESFQDHMVDVDKRHNPLLQKNLLILKGKDWKNSKSKISPAFTTSKVKAMVPYMVKYSKVIQEMLKSSKEISLLELQDIIGRYTIDCMSPISLGVDADCLRNPDSIFGKIRETFFQTDLTGTVKNALLFIAPNLFRTLKISLVPEEVTKFFTTTVQNSLKKAKENDLLQLFSRLGEKETGTGEKSINDITSYALEFFIGGIGLPPQMLLFALHALAENEKIQTKARNEIKQVLAEYDGVVSYESVSEMEYLERIVDETLRKYFLGYGHDRVCTKDYKIPNSDSVIKKGTVVIIPFMCLQWDEEYFPDPEVFDPDRFSEEQKASRHRYSYLPLGEGPRACIGRKIGYLEIMIALVELLLKYKFEISDDSHQSVEYNVRTYLPMVQKGPKIKITSLENGKDSQKWTNCGRNFVQKG